MATVAWPSASLVPTKIEQSGYSERPSKFVRSFQPDAGPPLISRKSGTSLVYIAGMTSQLTSTQWDALLTFYSTTCLSGANLFTRPHPRTLATITCQWVEAPELAEVDGIYYKARLSFLKF